MFKTKIIGPASRNRTHIKGLEDPCIIRYTIARLFNAVWLLDHREQTARRETSAAVEGPCIQSCPEC